MLTPFILCPSIVQEMLCLWCLLLCLGFSVNMVMSVHQHSFLYALASAFSLLFPYALINIRLELYYRMDSAAANAFAAYVGSLPVTAFVLTMVLLSAAWIIRFKKCLAYTDSHITPSSVKEAADSLSAGLCYYHENGQPYLSNHLMNQLCFEITGRALLNGNEFFGALNGRGLVELKDGRVYRFAIKDLSLSGEHFRELIAYDVTELIGKSRKLNEENQRLRRHNDNMIEYGKQIDDIVRREESLKNKTHIHDEMNRLLLATDRAIQSSENNEKFSILGVLQQNMFWLFMEADYRDTNNVYSDLESLSSLLGIRLVYRGKALTGDEDALHLFMLAAREAMTNAVKHGEARNLYIYLSEDADSLQASFTNDGKPPDPFAGEGGGLSRLRQRIEEAGGSMEVNHSPRFMLRISVPKGGRQNVL